MCIPATTTIQQLMKKQGQQFSLAKLLNEIIFFLFFWELKKIFLFIKIRITVSTVINKQKKKKSIFFYSNGPNIL